MRKIIVLALALCLTLGCFVTAEAAQIITYDFGDFTMEFPDDILCDVTEVSDGATFGFFYENYVDGAPFNDNMNIQWQSGSDDLSTFDPGQTAQSIVSTVMDSFESMGVAVSNPTVIDGAHGELSGKPALLLGYSYDVDYNNFGIDYQTTIFVIQAIVSEEGLGTYTFTVSCEDVNNTPTIDGMMDSIAWKD